MSHAVVKQRLTPEDYLATEEAADHKSEYYNGEVFAMAGSSPAHSLINLNVGGELRARLRGSQCRAYDAGLHVYVPATSLYTYPDVSVICGPLQYQAASKRLVTNPSLIVEVLSPSTEPYDRAAKFFHYQSIKTLRDYVLISQDMPRVEHFFRQAGSEQSSQWLYTTCHGVDAVLRLPSLGIEVPLREIYDNVEFVPPEGGPSAEISPHPGAPPA